MHTNFIQHWTQWLNSTQPPKSQSQSQSQSAAVLIFILLPLPVSLPARIECGFHIRNTLGCSFHTPKAYVCFTLTGIATALSQVWLSSRSLTLLDDCYSLLSALQFKFSQGQACKLARRLSLIWRARRLTDFFEWRMVWQEWSFYTCNKSVLILLTVYGFSHLFFVSCLGVRVSLIHLVLFFVLRIYSIVLVLVLNSLQSNSNKRHCK